MATATTAREFYGEAYGRAKDPTKLELAFERLGKACGTPNPSLGDKMLTLAAKSESEAFSG